MKQITIIILILLSLGCSRKTTETVYSHTTDTVHHTTTLYETLLERDSVLVYINGDTVRIRETKWRNREKTLHDTVYEHKTDTLYLENIRYVEKPVERKLTWWERVRLDSWLTLAGVVVVAVFWKRIGSAWRKITGK